MQVNFHADSGDRGTVEADTNVGRNSSDPFVTLDFRTDKGDSVVMFFRTVDALAQLINAASTALCGLTDLQTEAASRRAAAEACVVRHDQPEHAPDTGDPIA